MKYDEFLHIVGEYGKLQKIQTVVLALVAIISACHSLSIVFLSASPVHHCSIPEHLNETYFTLKNSTEINETDSLSYKKSCTLNFINTTEVIDVQSGKISKNVQVSELGCVYGYEFETDVYKSTVVSEWGLVCDKAWQRAMPGSIFFAGRLFGAVLVSTVSDKLGRRYIFFISVTLQSLLGSAAAFSPWLWLFYTFYFFQGIFQNVTYITAFVMGTEMVGLSYRKMVGLTMKTSYAAGLIVLAGVAALIRDWRYLELAISVPMIFFLATFRYFPESVRWLLSQGRKKEAEAIINWMAPVNGVTIPEGLVDELEIEDTTVDSSFLQIFKHWHLFTLAINVWFCLTVNTLVYYGLMLDSTNLHGDPYQNFAIGGAIEIPALIIIAVILDKVGRKPILIVCMVVGGTCLLINAFIPKEHYFVIMGLSLIGRFTITSSYAISYLMTAEVFPTVVRAAGVAVGNVISRGAGVLAPQVVILGEMLQTTKVRPHYLVFGATSIVAAILVLKLPEPTNKPLPQTFNDILVKKKNKRSKSDEEGTMLSTEEKT